MGLPTNPPISLNDLAGFQAAAEVFSSLGATVKAEIALGGEVSRLGWENLTNSYKGIVCICNNAEGIGWDYDLTTVSISQAAYTCAPGYKVRVSTGEQYDFLVYVLEKEPAGVVNELSGADIVDFEVSNSGSSYSIIFTFSGSPTFTKVASATLSKSGKFGSIAVS